MTQVRDRAWARGPVASAVREALLLGVLGPAMDVYMRGTVTGSEHLHEVEGPVLFVATHASHVDTPTILRALPREWRRRTAVAAAADYFYARRGRADLVSLVFNTVPVERKDPDAGERLARLIAEGWSLVVYAEGTRSRDGTVGRLHSGAALLAAEHGLAIVPVRVAGTHAVMPPGRSWPRRAPGGRHPITVHFGPPVRPRPGEHRTEVMDRVRQFFASTGAATTPDKRILARERRSATGA